MANQKNKVFNKWDPIEYVKEYFPPNVNTEPMVKFIAEQASKRLKEGTIAIDVGCGPTVCYWSALTPYVQEIHLSDFLDSNLNQIKRWIDYDELSESWDFYTRMSMECEGFENIDDVQLIARKNSSKSKVKGFLHCDISKHNPLGFHALYDCVLSACVADSITYDKMQWSKYMMNIFSLIKPGGTFIGSSMLSCKHYDIGDIEFPSANITEYDFESLLREYGFEEIEVRVEDESRPLFLSESEKLRPEYEKIILASGKLP